MLASTRVHVVDPRPAPLAQIWAVLGDNKRMQDIQETDHIVGYQVPAPWAPRAEERVRQTPEYPEALAAFLSMYGVDDIKKKDKYLLDSLQEVLR
jgi:hypothetical protein